MMTHKLLIADGLGAEGIARLKDLGGLEILEFKDIPRAELEKMLGPVHILVVRSRTQVDTALLDKGTSLKLVIRAGIGLDNVDVAAATDRGVVVMNAPTGNIVTTAEHTLALLFAATRHVPQADAALRAGKWEKKKFQGNELRGKKLGIVGLGNIGKAVAERAAGLRMEIVGFDPYLSAEAAAKHGVRLAPFDELLAICDYVTVHVPLTAATHHLIGREALAKMKKGAYLINCARGGIVDETALVEALESGHLAAAALDVFETEPLPADHPLLKRGDVVLTPHLGASTDEAQVQVGLEVAEQVTQYLRDGALKNAVNVPNVTAEQLMVMKPFLSLCERLGAFASQISETQSLKGIRIRYEGSLEGCDPAILTLSILKGVLTPMLSTPVNFVNVRKLVKERGLRVEESFDADCRDYQTLVELKLDGTTVSGTIFGKQEARIVKIDDFAIDAVPSGYLLFTRNVDQPGVIGTMGTLLANQGVNIARMHLGRDEKKREAIALINVDSQLDQAGLDALRKAKGMLTVKQIHL